MRQLHVYAGPFPSHQGTQVYLRGLLGAQAGAGDTVALRCWAGGAGAAPAGVQVRRLARGRDLASGPSLRRAPLAVALAAALAQDLREPWDAVHLHHVEAPLLGPAVRGPLRVHHLHTCLAEELPTYAGMGLAGAAVGAALDRACARGADLTVALSERGAALARGWGARRAIVIRPGVEPAPDLAADEARRALGLAGDRWIAYTGNLDGYQDLDRLLRAAALADLQLLVATGARLDPLRAAARRAGLPERRLTLVQTRDHAAVQRVLAASVAAVVPRARCAGFPMKALNALAAGRPLVALRGALDPMPGVVLVDRPTPEALAAALVALLADPARAAALGSRGRAALPRWADAAAALRAAVLRARSGASL